MPMKLEGLVAATYTPMHVDGRLNGSMIPALTEHLLGQGVAGLYVCGSTGEGVSLTTDERREVAEAFVAASNGRLPVIVQIGHQSTAEARQLAEHAQAIGATAISANAPSYFSIDSAETLAQCMADVAAGAPELPFYYYHIPALTGVNINVPAFLEHAAVRIPNLAGVKYTAPTVDEYQQCLEWDGGRLDVLWGMDEMLLPALAVGARGAVGSTYNIMAPLYHQLLAAFEAGDLKAARTAQAQSIRIIRTLKGFPFHPAMKHALGLLGVPCGPCRLPQRLLTDDQKTALASALDQIDFYKTIASATDTTTRTRTAHAE